MGRLYDAFIEVGPRFTGFGDIKKQGDQAGKAYGKALGDAAVKAAQANVRNLGAALAKARSAEADAAGKVRVAEAKLNETRASGKATTSQLVRAEESLAAAQRKSASAADTTKHATEALGKSQKQLAGAAEQAGKSSGGRFTGAFKGSLSKIGGEKEGRQVATRFGVGLNGAFGGIVSRSAGIFAAGFAAIQSAKVFGGFIKDAAESEKISRITANAIRATGGAAKITAGQVSALATSISNKTAIDDEQVQTAANMLLTFKNIRNESGKNNDIFNRATQAAADLSIQFGGMDGASKQLGKALNDPIKGTTALAKAGVTFTEQQKKQIKTLTESGDVLGAQKIILKEIEGQVGGAAAAAADPMERLKVVAGNLGEEIGGVLLPGVNKFATFISDKAIPAISELFGFFKTGDFTKGFREAFHVEEDSKFVDFLFKVRDGASAAFGFFKTDVVPILKSFGGYLLGTVLPAVGQFIGSLAERLGPVLRDAFGYFKSDVLPILQEFATFFYTKILPAVSAFVSFLVTTLAPVVRDLVTKGMEGAKLAIDRVKTAFQENEPQIRKFIEVVGIVVKWIAEKLGPILGWLAGKQMKWVGDQIALVITAIGKFVTAVQSVIGWVKTAGTKIAEVWTGVKSASQTALTFVVQKFLGFVGALVNGAAKAFGWVPGIGPKLKTAAAEFETFKKSVNEDLAGIKDQTINVQMKYSSKGVNLTAPGASRVAAATGGKILGPGTPTSDSIPAMLSNSEWVIKGKSSAKYGDRAMRSVNDGTATIIPADGYAAGGRPGLSVKTSLPSSHKLANEVASHAVLLSKPYLAELAKQLNSNGIGGPPGSVRSYRGQKLNDRTIRMLNNAERILGAVFHITQGSYSTRVAASGSTHAGGGAMDTNGPRGWGAAVAALRKAGFAAWHRTPSQGPWNDHIHSIALGDTSASAAAKAQMASFRRGGDGLGHGMKMGGRVLVRDQGGPLPHGMFAYNGSGKTETVRTAEQERALGGGQVGLLTITNWQDGTGHFRLIARDEIGSESEFNNAVGRMHR
jgi:acid phosphatase family membrane protein YuiD